MRQSRTCIDQILEYLISLKIGWIRVFSAEEVSDDYNDQDNAFYSCHDHSLSSVIDHHCHDCQKRLISHCVCSILSGENGA